MLRHSGLSETRRQEFSRRCLIYAFQVFFADDIHEIVSLSAVGSIYPHSYSVVHDKDGQVSSGYTSQPSCSIVPLYTFFTCYVGYCFGAGGEGESPSCIIANCSAEFTDLTEDCHACIGTSGVYISDILMDI